MSSSPPTSTEEAKEWCIESAAESGSKSSLSCHHLPQSIVNLTMLDSELVEHMGLHALLNVGFDMETALNDTVERSKNIRYSLRVSEWLVKSSDAVVKAMKEKVERSMESELRSYVTGKLDVTMSFEEKAAVIARTRSKRHLRGSLSSVLTKRIAKDKHYEFQVCLTRLIGGHGGTCKVEHLSFQYIVSFDKFLKALQEATVLCTIPPVDFTLDTPETHTTSDPISYYPSFRDINPLPEKMPKSPNISKSHISDMHQPKADDTLAEAGPGLLKPKQDDTKDISAGTDSGQRTRSQRGYTLQDGPWIYRISYKSCPDNADEQHLPRDFPKATIAGENDYRRMVGILQDTNQRHMGGEYVVTMMHSQESAVQIKWNDKQRQEEFDEQLERKSWLEENGIREGDDSDLGEPWMHWWTKTTGHGGYL